MNKMLDELSEFFRTPEAKEAEKLGVEIATTLNPVAGEIAGGVVGVMNAAVDTLDPAAPLAPDGTDSASIAAKGVASNPAADPAIARIEALESAFVHLLAIVQAHDAALTPMMQKLGL